MPRDLQILLPDDHYLTLIMQRLDQQTTKLLVATVPPLLYLVSNTWLNNTGLPENSSEP